MTSNREGSSPASLERSNSEDSSSWPCSCGTGDGSGNYIQCDNEQCTVVWYHWECVQVFEEPAGKWLCPKCSPSAAYYVKQLVKERGSKGEERHQQEPTLEIKKKEEANKGVATKKPAPDKPKPRWVGWVELSSDGEEEFKRKVDAKWSVEDDVVRKRRRTSKAMAEENGNSTRRLEFSSRAKGKKRAVETESDEEKETDGKASIYQEEEEEEEEEIEEQEHEREHNQDDPQDSMDMEYQDESIEAHVSNPSDGSESDESDDFVSAVSRISANTSEGSERLHSLNPPPESASSIDPSSASALSSGLQVSEPRVGRENTMDVDAENDGHEDQGLGTVSPAAESSDFVALYQRQGNCWGEFPESAIRSTLRRLG